MFGGDEGACPEETPIERFNRQLRERERRVGITPMTEDKSRVIPMTFEPQPHPDAGGSVGSKIAELNREHKQWTDHGYESQVIPPYSLGETWFVKLPGATALATASITDVTNQTVELSTRFGSKSRYIKSEINFVEKVS